MDKILNSKKGEMNIKNRKSDKAIAEMLDKADKKPEGLTLISAATGGGKTTQVIDYAVKSINNGRFKKVIYIGPRHAILSEVRVKIEKKAGSKALYLNSFVNNVKNNIKSIDLDLIKDSDIKDKINKLNSLSESVDKSKGKQKNSIEKEISEIKRELKRYCIDNKENLEDDIKEVSKIFPENMKDETQYILMTMDKLFYSFDSLDKDNLILSEKIFNKDTLVIIDELDKCYGITLKKVSENFIKNDYEFICNDKNRSSAYLTCPEIGLTPEDIFVSLCEHSNVLALSATQQIPTVLSLDLEHMKKELGDKFDCYSCEDFEYANKNIEITQNIHCDIVETFNEDIEKLISRIKQIFEDERIKIPDKLEELVSSYVSKIKKLCGSDHYKCNREFKRFYAINQLLLRKNAVSGIIILNSNFTLIDELRNYIDFVTEQCKTVTMDKRNIYFLSASNIGQEIDGIKDKLNAGNKCLIISNKEVLGQGVNIQYKKDFNFIYLEDPTYIFPVVKRGQSFSKKEMNRYIYLVRKMQLSGEIDKIEMEKWIEDIVANKNHKFNSYKSVKNAKTSIFIQGLGRVNRNSDKEEHEYIYIDEDLCGSLQLEDAQVEKTQELLAVEERINQYRKQGKENEQIYLQNSIDNYESDPYSWSDELLQLIYA